MDSEEALAFLRRHQPLPDDDHLDASLIGEFEEVRRYFADHPDDRCVPLLLGSFGDGSGFGVYQLVEDAVRSHTRDVVIANLRIAIESSSRSARYWALQIATAGFADRSFVTGALNVLRSSPSSDERFWAAQLMAQIYDVDQDRNLLLEILENESDAETLSVLAELSNR